MKSSDPLLYSMGSYYDIDAILTDAQKVPCTFDLDMSGLGYLDENAGGDVQSPPLPFFPSSDSSSPENYSCIATLIPFLIDKSRYPRFPSPLAQHPTRGPTSWSLFSSIMYSRFAGFYIAKGFGSIESRAEDCGSKAVGKSLLRLGG